MTATGRPKTIPIVPVAHDEAGDCAGAEPFVLMVLGDSMAPEFAEGEIIVVEPEGLAVDGSFVVARAGGGWELRALDAACPAVAIPDLAPVRGVVIQKSKPGRRRAAKRYVE